MKNYLSFAGDIFYSLSFSLSECVLTAKGIQVYHWEQKCFPQRPADVTEARVKHLLHFRQGPCLTSFCCPQSARHKALYPRGAQSYLLDERVR